MSQKAILELLSLLRPVTLNVGLCRVGGKNDGGYILPSDYYEHTSDAFSLGVAGDNKFDLDYANKVINVYQFDPSIDYAPTIHPLLKFIKEVLGSMKKLFS
jgi:hypothetical protein